MKPEFTPLPLPLFLLGLLFVGLKITNVIAWSWWWITLPFWGAVALCASILSLGFLYGAAKIFVVASLQKRKR